MKFEKIRFKNILSYGNKFTEIDLNCNLTVLLSGTNGKGKSTFLDAISFVLTGKPYRKIKKDQLLNNINKKNLLVELEISVGEDVYLIRRGIKPNVFDIFKNKDKVDEESSILSQQETLENLVGFSSEVPKQTFAVSSRFYSPFLEMNAATKRQFVENIFSMSMFSDMNELLKQKRSSLKLEIKDKEKDIEKFESNIALLENLEEDVDIEDCKKQINILKETLNEHEEKIKQLDEFIEKRQTVLDEHQLKLDEKFSKIRKVEYGTKSKLDVVNEKISFYRDTDNCPTCGQKIEEGCVDISKLEEEKTKYENDIKKCEKAKEKLNDNKDKLSDIESKKQVAEKKKRTQEEHVMALQYNIKDLKNLITNANKKKQNTEKQKQEYTQQIEDTKATLFELGRKSECYATVNEIISEKGIKQYIISKYIPLINKKVNDYLQILDAPYSLFFNDKLQERIEAVGYDDLSYGNLSSGEKQRVDLAVLFTFIEVSKMNNSLDSNFLVIDEVLDASLDEEGIDNVVKILNLLKRKGYTIFVVSHRENINTCFDKTLHVSKNKFSEIEELA